MKPFTAKVIHGRKVGRTLGFPTANLKCNESPEERGVFAVEVYLYSSSCKDSPICRKGIMNIGMRPTFQNPELSIEVHLIDFDEDIYGCSLEVHPICKIRDEKKFSNIEALQLQIQADLEKAAKILSQESLNQSFHE